MSQFTRLIKGLQTLLPSSGTEPHSVAELGETVVPTMRFPGRAIALADNIRTLQTLSASVVTPILVAISAGPEEWVELMAGDISHDSATSRNVQMVLADPVGFLTFIGRWTNMASALGAGVPSGFEPIYGSTGSTAAADTRICPQRPVIVPPRWELQFRGNTAGVAYALNASLIIVRHSFPEDPISW